MKTKTIMFRILMLLAVLLLPTSSVYAQGPSGDIVRFGEDFTLEKGESLNGSIAVFGGDILLESASELTGDMVVFGGGITAEKDVVIDGDMVVFGGEILIEGTVDGDMVVFGGQIELSKDAVVNGDITTIGGQVNQEPGAEVNGTITNNAPPINVPDIEVPGTPGTPNVPGQPEIRFGYNPFWEALNVLFRAVAVAAVGMFLSLFFQTQFERVGDAITRQPVVAGSFGLLTVIVAPLLILILVVTLILIPVALVVIFLIPLAWLFGAIALGQEVGDRFTRAINQTWAPVLTNGFGTFLLMIVGGYLGMIPCVGWMVPFVIGLLATGGVMMTWFGTRNPPVSTRAVEGQAAG